MPIKNNKRPKKSQATPTKKLIAQSNKAAQRALTDQWRLLRKLGAYKTKESPAEKRLTPSRVRAIKTKVAEIQRQGKYKQGKTLRPIIFGERKTRTGKTVIDYHLSPHFEFVRTKYAPSAIEGVKKVGGGYLIEKTRPGTKLLVNKRGDIIERMGREQRTRRRMSGRDLLNFVDRIDSGKVKFKKHDVIHLHSWGAGMYQTYDAEDNGKQFGNYISSLMRTMDEITFDRYARSTYIEIVKEILD